MIFTGMSLLEEAAYSGFTGANDNEQVFDYKSIVS